MSWPSVKISDVCTLINGRAYKQHELLSEGKYKVLRVGNFFSNKDWYYSSLELPEDKYCERGDLLYAWSASFGPRIWDGKKVIYHYHIWKIVIDEMLIDKKYLFYALQNDVESIKREQGTGSTMIHVTKAAMEDRLIPLPPLPEQKRIAAILDKADAIRRKRQQAIQLADDFLRAVFLDMFGDPATNPNGWPVYKMSDVIDFKGGSQPPKETFEYEEKEGYIRLVQIRDFRTDKFKTYIPEHLARRRFEIDDVMIGRYGPPVFQILRGLSGSYNVALMKAVPKGGVTKDFIYRLLQLPTYQDAVISNSERTAGQTGVNLDLLNSLDVPLPPLEVQSSISKRIRKTEALLNKLKLDLEDAEQLFSSISQNAFPGKL